MNAPEQPDLSNGVVVNGFSDYNVKKFKRDFDRIRSMGFPIIPVFIDSYGGEIYSLLAMLDIIKYSDIPVATIAMGKAMSCGSILLSAGYPGLRFAGDHSTIMIHDAATVSIGKIEELKNDVGEAERLNDKMFEILDKNCCKPSGYFQELLAAKKHTNLYLDAKEAFGHGIVDNIGLPTMIPEYRFDVLTLNLPQLEAPEEVKPKKPRKRSAKKPTAKKSTKKTTKKSTKKKTTKKSDKEVKK
jgi:ATP-dependent Clp endopeptidase proteolytic subunit ClpP